MVHITLCAALVLLHLHLKLSHLILPPHLVLVLKLFIRIETLATCGTCAEVVGAAARDPNHHHQSLRSTAGSHLNKTHCCAICPQPAYYDDVHPTEQIGMRGFLEPELRMVRRILGRIVNNQSMNLLLFQKYEN